MKKIMIGIFIIIVLCATGCKESEGRIEMISKEEASEMMKNQDVIIVDVRTFYEYEQGHIKGAINIPLSMIDENNQDMPGKGDTILLYCQSGNRSKQAASKFLELGYQYVYDFGGIQDWTGEIEKSV